ncbi:MAG: hypothetical protein J6S85_11545 [Methanobrevibacter sp.]|mgnify:CR=1 FL=1|nr:hypothetical protein [Methanobrevibacter sp.]
MGLRKIKKNVAENKFLFPLEMYTSFPGSVIITSYILNENKPDVLNIRKKWKYYLRHGLDFDFSDPDYLKKVCELFEVKMFPLELAAFVQSEYNALICPYIENEEGFRDIYPLREDGYYSRTLRKGKIYPLVEKVKNGECCK